MTAKPGGSEKKYLTRQKRKRSEVRSKKPPFYAKAARKNYRDEMHYALIDTNTLSGNLPKDQLETIKDMVTNKM